MTLAISGSLAVIPAFLLLCYFYRRDLHPEPRGVLFMTFLLGVGTVIPVLLVATPLMVFKPGFTHPLYTGLYIAFCVAAIPEEFFKFLVVRYYCTRQPAFDEPMDGIVYGATASLGFATLENILYVQGSGWDIALARALTAVPAHACCGAIMGYFVGQARLIRGRQMWAWYGLLIAMLLHGLYDVGPITFERMPYLLLLTNLPQEELILGLGLLGSFLGVLLVEVIWAWLLVRRLRRAQERQAGLTEA